MTPTTLVRLIDFELERPGDEVAFMAWWERAERLLVEKFRATGAELFVFARGRYRARLGFPLPGVWRLVTQDRRWRELEEARPPARMAESAARLWHRAGNPRDVTTTELKELLDERDLGGRDLALVDVLPRESYAERHLPGAVNLPLAEIDEQRARAAIGPDLGRTVVVYCSGYG